MVIERERKFPRDYEVMDSVLERGDAKELALCLHVNPQLVRSWCREPELESPKASGKFNPLARIRTLCAMSREIDADFVRRCANILKEAG